MRRFKADLHIHTCLSPCGDYGMYPSAIVNRAVERDLDIIAICDHNSSGNVEAVIAAGKKVGLTVFGGMEICSEEEVHLLTLFEDLNDLKKMDKVISRTILEFNDIELFGEQVLFDENDKIIGLEDKLLMSACSLTIEEIVDLTQKNNGLVIPSHINRDSYGLLGVLGFIPEDISFDALEIMNSGFSGWENLLQTDLTFVHSSDAHFLEQIGSDYTVFELAFPSLREIGLAFKKFGGRKVFK
ncbi:MAG: PHP domain-containing protein [Spirochaetaceae bacterium]|nr:PHP domain-containing protein [Spirochaetaceae bacterium]